MTPLRALTEKPWLTSGIGPAGAPQVDEPQGWDRGIGLGLFLVVVTMIFGLVSMAYMMRMGHGTAAGTNDSDWLIFREPPLLWINTAILAASSLAFLLADRRAHASDAAGARGGVIAGGVLGTAFLAGQLVLWKRLGDWGYVLLYSSSVCRPGEPLSTFPFPTTILGNPALAFFFLISGLHGLHILGGLFAWTLTMRELLADGTGAARAVELCARYWHFLLVVWALMMALFVAT